MQQSLTRRIIKNKSPVKEGLHDDTVTKRLNNVQQSLTRRIIKNKSRVKEEFNDETGLRQV